MIVSGIEKLSLVDFDGFTACVIFTGGCNMRCPFCHNSPLVAAKSLPRVNEGEIFGFLKKRAGLLDAVVITGGEPTLHGGLPEFIAKIKKLDYKVKLDTNGTNPGMLDALISARLVDYAAMDIKNSKEKYALTAGAAVDIASIEKSAEILKKGLIGYEFRTTLVENFHTAEDIQKIGLWLRGAKKHFLQQFVDRDTCLARGLASVPKERAEEYKAILEKYIDIVRLRGY